MAGTAASWRGIMARGSGSGQTGDNTKNILLVLDLADVSAYVHPGLTCGKQHQRAAFRTIRRVCQDKHCGVHTAYLQTYSAETRAVGCLLCVRTFSNLAEGK